MTFKRLSSKHTVTILMIKISCRNLLTTLTTTLVIGAVSFTVFSADAQDADTLERVKKLEDTVQTLMEQNAALQKQLDQLQGKKETEPPEVVPSAGSESTEKEEGAKTLYGDRDVRVYWDNGLKFESGDGKTFKGTFGGRIQMDAAAYSADDDIKAITEDSFDSAVEFRRARLHTTGEFSSSTPVAYKLEVDFAGDEVALKDIYLALKKIPYAGEIKVGHFKEPFGLDELTSSRFITFMERSPVIEAFAPSRNYGIEASNTAFDDRMSWAAGVFTDTGSTGRDVQTIEGNVRGTARITGLPYYKDEGRELVHLGISGSVIDPSENMVRYRARPGSHLAPRFVDTGSDAISSDFAYLLGAEAAWVHGPYSLQAEYIRSGVSRDGAGSDLNFGGVYVYGSWFLTGEHRKYKTSSGTFDRVKPNHNFSIGEGGLGAWEFSVRYSHLDLEDADIDGGKLEEIAAGLNWYLNPNTRAMFNYGYAKADYRAEDGHSHIFQGRVQVDF